MAVTVLDELLNADGSLPAVKVQVGAKLVTRASTATHKAGC
jgi:LacI family transcriptional regulator|tara:strand:+ start:2656 stop:2778 length:123 start_codon:yes stop_codon:yes gene_type:complete